MSRNIKLSVILNVSPQVKRVVITIKSRIILFISSFCNMRDAGYGALFAGCGALFAECGALIVGCRALIVGCEI